MRGIARLKRDERGRGGAKFTLVIALLAMPLLYPTRTLGVLKGAQSSWEHVWTIDGLSGGA